jgi:hypothetical protein
VEQGNGVGFVLLEETKQVLSLLDGVVVGLRDQLERLVELSLHYTLD